MYNKKLLWCAVGLMVIALMLTSCSSKSQVKGVLVRRDGEMDFVKTDDGGPRLIEVTEGQRVDLGEIQVGP